MTNKEREEYLQRELYNIDVRLSTKLTRKQLGVCLGVLTELQKIHKDPEIQSRIDNICKRLSAGSENNLSL